MHGTGRRWARPHGTGLSPRCAKSTPSLSLRLAAIPAKDSHACCTPWSVFQDGSNGSLSKASAHGTHCDRTPAYLQPCAANTAGSPGHDGAAHRRRPALRARAAKAKGRHSPRSAASSAPRGQHRGRRGPGQLPTRNTNPTHQTGADPAPAPLQQVPRRAESRRQHSTRRAVKQPPERAHRDTCRHRHPTAAHGLPQQRFHALFDSLFKVLFTFPSRYLFAIGLAPVFSLGWSLPPTLGCTTKQPDSQRRPHTSGAPRPPQTGLSPSPARFATATLRAPAAEKTPLQTTIPRGRPAGDSRLGLFPLHSPLLGES